MRNLKGTIQGDLMTPGPPEPEPCTCLAKSKNISSFGMLKRGNELILLYYKTQILLYSCKQLLPTCSWTTRFMLLMLLPALFLVSMYSPQGKSKLFSCKCFVHMKEFSCVCAVFISTFSIFERVGNHKNADYVILGSSSSIINVRKRACGPFCLDDRVVRGPPLAPPAKLGNAWITDSSPCTQHTEMSVFWSGQIHVMFQ